MWPNRPRDSGLTWGPTVSTGHVACRITFSAVDPDNSLLIPPRPCVPMTMRSMLLLHAISLRTSQASPDSTITSCGKDFSSSVCSSSATFRSALLCNQVVHWQLHLHACGAGIGWHRMGDEKLGLVTLSQGKSVLKGKLRLGREVRRQQYLADCHTGEFRN